MWLELGGNTFVFPTNSLSNNRPVSDPFMIILFFHVLMKNAYPFIKSAYTLR